MRTDRWQRQKIYRESILPLLFLMTFACLLRGSAWGNGVGIAAALNIVGWQGIIIAILAMGTVFPAALGEFDFSVNAICGICSLFYVYCSNNVSLAPVFCILLGAALGALNALIAGWLRISPTIVTFVAAQFMIMFSSRILPSGSILFARRETASLFILRQSWRLTVGGVCVAFLVMAVILFLGQYLLRYSYQGKCLTAVGESEKNARQMGVNPFVIKILAFSWSGVFASFAAMVLTGRQGFGEATAGAGFELYSLSAMLLAGHKMKNGRGTAAAILISSMFVAAIRQCCMKYFYPLFYSNILPGFLLLFGLGAYRWRKRRFD